MAKFKQRTMRIGTAYQLLKEGMTQNQVAKLFTKEFGITEASAIQMVYDAYNLSKYAVERDPEVIRSIHTSRYDKLFSDNKDLYKEWIKFPQERGDFAHNAEILSIYKNVLKAMLRKEKILGMHATEAAEVIADVFFNPDEKVAKEKEKQDYVNKALDYDTMEFKDLDRLVNLLDKTFSKKDSFDPAPAPDGSVEYDAETITEVDPQKSMEVSPAPDITRTSVTKYRLDQKLEDHKKSETDVKELLRESMRKKIEEAYGKVDQGRDNKGKNLNVVDGNKVKITLSNKGD